jgi:hypothetical protein
MIAEELCIFKYFLVELFYDSPAFEFYECSG